jgi:hypothetical protein
MDRAKIQIRADHAPDLKINYSPDTLWRMADQADGTELVMVRGIGCAYRLWNVYRNERAPEEGGYMVMCQHAEAGSLQGVTKYNATAQECPTWMIPHMDDYEDRDQWAAEVIAVQTDASLYVLRVAMEEVAQEYE